MQLTTEQESFKQLFAERLRNKADKDGVHLAAGAEIDIAQEFIEALIKFKSDLSADNSTYRQTRGETAWTEGRQQLIEEFSLKLSKIFEPIGGLKPREASAYWSGAAVKRAGSFGKDFASTIPGFVMNEVSSLLQEVFTKKAYNPDGTLDTATNLAIWDAMSKLYAEGTTQNAHVFLVDGETSQQSIFWNTELQTLRKRQFSGEVKEIYLHTLTEEALREYRALLTEKKDPSNRDSVNQQIIGRKIDKFLQDGAHWTSTPLDDSTAFKLKISGLTEPHQTIDYQRIKQIAQRFKNVVPQRRTEEFEKQFAEMTKSLEEGKEPSEILGKLEVLKQNVQQLREGQRGDALTKHRLERLEEAISDKIMELDSPQVAEDHNLGI